MKAKLIMFGEYTKPDWHPLKIIEPHIKKALSGADIDFTEDREKLNSDFLKHYDCVILYFDRWNEKFSPEQCYGLLNYVAQGGKLLVLHNGISVQANYELAQMVGARFIGHPERQDITLKPVAGISHPIIDGIGEITLFEEPYKYDFCNFSERTVLMTYELNGENIPALWVSSFCRGRIVYLMPGHDEQTVSNNKFAELLCSCVKWLCTEENSE